MSFSLRNFIIDDYENIRRIPATTISRLFNGDVEVAFKEYSNKTMKCVVVSVENENRKPISIVRFICNYLPFDSLGMLDMNAINEHTMSAIESFVPKDEEKNENIITSEEEAFRLKKLKNKYSWVLSDELKSRIHKEIFKKKSTLKLIKNKSVLFNPLVN